jgi:hypothetical protein
MKRKAQADDADGSPVKRQKKTDRETDDLLASIILPPPPGQIPSRSPSPSTRKNVGGASRLEWFNILVQHRALASVRQNLYQKIERQEAIMGGTEGCVRVLGFTEETRPAPDKVQLELFRSVVESAPARLSAYHIALARASKVIPSCDPPPYPKELRLVKHKRTSSAALDNEKSATWVASHLCHNRLCVNPAHLTWEPSWMNRLRDNCPGGATCVHRPEPCLRSHRTPQSDLLIDWTTYINAGGPGEGPEKEEFFAVDG